MLCFAQKYTQRESSISVSLHLVMTDPLYLVVQQTPGSGCKPISKSFITLLLNEIHQV